MKSLNISKYSLKGVKGRVCVMGEIVIPTFMTIMVKAVAKLMTHSKHMNMVIKPIVGYSDMVPYREIILLVTFNII